MIGFAKRDGWETMDDILDFAIDKEQEAVEFYTALAARAENKAMRKVFVEFAGMESGHMAKLRGIKSSGRLDMLDSDFRTLKIADYLVDVNPTPGMSYQDALVVAMKRERAAENLYSDLAQVSPTAAMRELMLALAAEETAHRLRLETEYDEYVLKED